LVAELAFKRLRLNLRSARLVLLTVTMLALMVGVGMRAEQRYRERRELYEAARLAHLFALEDARYYQQVRLGLERPPELLSLIAEGTGERYGTSVIIRGQYGPLEIRARERPEALSAEDGALDLAHLWGLFFSLLALLLSYDIICGERQEGTLQLALANALPRYKLLMGEFVGCFLSLLVPLLLASLFALAMLRALSGFALVGEELLRAGLVFLGVLLLTSALLWLGLCCSALSRETPTAFILAFGMWVALSVAFPNLASWIAQRLRPIPITEEVLSSEGVFGLALEERKDEPSPEYERARAQMRESALNEKLEQGRMNDSLKLLSPVSSFLALAQILARTDLSAQRDFLAQAHRLNDEFRRWQAEKLRRYPERESYYDPRWGPLDIEGLPEARFAPLPLEASLQVAWPYWASLIIFNIVFGYLALLLALRYDVRFR
jgi:ABC-type transport system involved in multi-copper enzyme maturation permease subunit